MQELIAKVNQLKQNHVGKLVKQRMLEFDEVAKSPEKVFSELCFCLTTANSSAEMGIKVQKAIRNELTLLSRAQLSKRLRKLGYRFYNVRAKYIVEARKHQNVKSMVESFDNELEAREWLVENVLGLGYKEASHFLRNIGYMNVAILDRHIIRVMHESRMMGELPKTLNRKRYLEYEKRLEPLCNATGLKQGELDFYLWYMKTGKILK
jgi:N-glycosylase/DNA lyase